MFFHVMFLIPKSQNLRLQPGLQMLGSGGQILPTCLALYMKKHVISSKNRRKVCQIEKQSKLKWAPGKCQSIISSKNNDYRSGLTSKTGSPFRLGGGETFPNFCCCLFFLGGK